MVAPTPAPAVASPTTTVRPPIALDGTPLQSCRLGGIEAVCGYLTVPEDPATPSGRTIDLHVAVIPAIASDPQPDPMFMLAGGPGGAATESLAWTAATYQGIHLTRDIVLVDQRGTGGSNELTLDEPPDVGGLAPDEVEATTERWIAEQLAGLDADPRFYTTSVAMDDLDLVREALGYDRINLYGGSYGATAAQYYIRQHDDRLRAVVLDGATLLDVPVFELIAPASQRALDIAFDRCAADPTCAAEYPDLRAEFDRALELASAEPITTGVTDPTTGTPFVIDRIAFTSAVHGALISADGVAALPLLVHAAAAERWDEVATAVVRASGGAPPRGGIQVMSGVIRCSEAWARFDVDEVTKQGAGSYHLEAEVAIARSQADGCQFAPPGIVPADDAEPARSDVPVLFLVGEADPQDPPSNIADAAEDFPNSLTIVAPGHGHTVAHLGCLPTVVDAFIAAGTVEGLDTSCVDEGGVPVPPFRLP
jgi:pimeloyl-ACP methyl ester carboxylesterase